MDRQNLQQSIRAFCKKELDEEARFRMRLALGLGKSLFEIENHLSGEELDLWREFYIDSPFGEDRNEMRNALLCSTIANSMGNKTTMKEFILFKKEEKKDIDAILASAFLAM